jgi:diguanylate cyclase (GGDEF)-like protein
MRQLALFGLIVAFLLGGIAIFETSETVTSRRNEQDRALQATVAAEVELISGGVRQTTTALSLVLVNPAVRDLLTDRQLPAATRKRDLADAALALGTIQRTAFLPLSAACLDDGRGVQLVCAPSARAIVFPTELGQRFVALADGAQPGVASGAFISPLTKQLSVAFLAPFRLHGQPLGLVHLDISTARAQGSTLLVNETPGVTLQLGGYRAGKVVLDGPSNGIQASALSAPRALPIGQLKLGQSPRSTLNQGHRAMLAALPLSVGDVHQAVAVAATAKPVDPSFLNAWSPLMLLVLGVAIVTLIGAIVGLAISNRRVVRELSTDALTGLRNRRALLEELPRVCQRASEEAPAFLWFFDLNGFKSYNDSFGHVAGDALLTRLGTRLRSAVGDYGAVYRLGGDEFCALISMPVRDPHALFHDAREALSEQGGAFTVTAAAGAVEIPRETRDATQALRLADQHMYREKATSRGGAAELITAVLHAALAQRHPDLGEHSDEVAGDVEVLARTIGLDDETIGLIIKAGDLHDVGKLGIPDEIITKPGPLNDEEWEFMKQHTVMGEQIIAAAGPSLERIGPLVRASHERWDGKGYPDGLAGEEIPLGARIITICDSFRAMLDVRAYKPAMALDDALAELRRCAGSQFDPALVDVFCRIVTDRTAIERLRSAAG